MIFYCNTSKKGQRLIEVQSDRVFVHSTTSALAGRCPVQVEDATTLSVPLLTVRILETSARDGPGGRAGYGGLLVPLKFGSLTPPTPHQNHSSGGPNHRSRESLRDVSLMSQWFSWVRTLTSIDNWHRGAKNTSRTKITSSAESTKQHKPHSRSPSEQYDSH